MQPWNRWRRTFLASLTRFRLSKADVGTKITQHESSLLKIIGSLSNKDETGNENVTRIVLMSQTIALHLWRRKKSSDDTFCFLEACNKTKGKNKSIERLNHVLQYHSVYSYYESTSHNGLVLFVRTTQDIKSMCLWSEYVCNCLRWLTYISSQIKKKSRRKKNLL